MPNNSRTPRIYNDRQQQPAAARVRVTTGARRAAHSKTLERRDLSARKQGVRRGAYRIRVAATPYRASTHHLISVYNTTASRSPYAHRGEIKNASRAPHLRKLPARYRDTPRGCSNNALARAHIALLTEIGEKRRAWRHVARQ